MSCRICGRSGCIPSFHSLKEQEYYNKYASLSERELIDECIDKDNTIADLNRILDKYEDAMKLED